MYGLVALAQRGKRPCTHLIDTLWKRCWPVSVCLIDAMLSFVTTLVHVSRIAASYLPERLHARTACEFSSAGIDVLSQLSWSVFVCLSRLH